MNKRHTKAFSLGIIMAFLGFVLLGTFVFMSDTTFAQNAATDTFGVAEIGENVNLGGGDIRVTIARIIRVVLSLLGIIAVSIIIYGGYIYMTAGGNADKVQQAKKILINGTIGLVIILSSLAITQWVLNKLAESTGVNLGDNSGCTSINDCNSPGNGYGSCFDQHFVVRSITPSQPETGMNNIVIRAVFSKPIKTPAENALKIFQGNTELTKTDVTENFTIIFADSSKKVLQAVYSGDGEFCADDNKQDDQTCLQVSESDYVVEVPKP